MLRSFFPTNLDQHCKLFFFFFLSSWISAVCNISEYLNSYFHIVILITFQSSVCYYFFLTLLPKSFKGSSQIRSSTNHKDCWLSKFLHQNVTSLLWPKTVLVLLRHSVKFPHSPPSSFLKEDPMHSGLFFVFSIWWMDHLVKNGSLNVNRMIWVKGKG